MLEAAEEERQTAFKEVTEWELSDFSTATIETPSQYAEGK